MRSLEASHPVACGIGEGSALVAEHLALEERLRYTTEVNLHERIVATAAVAVQRFGDEFLACAALAGNQHRGIGVGNAFHRSKYICHFLALAYDVAAVESLYSALFLLYSHFLLACQFEGCLYALHQCSVAPRLSHKVEGSCLHSFHSKVNASPCRHKYNRHIGAEYLHLSQQKDTLVATCGEGKIHIHEYEVGLCGSHYLHSLLGRGCCLHFVACPLEHETETAAYGTVVIYYKYHGYKFSLCLANCKQNRTIVVSASVSTHP